jgi:plasmid stabilization system protein ParE
MTNPSAALALIERIEKVVAALRLTPNMGRPGRVSGTRELVVTRTSFLVPYRVAEDRIEILAAIHAARR